MSLTGVKPEASLPSLPPGVCRPSSCLPGPRHSQAWDGTQRQRAGQA